MRVLDNWLLVATVECTVVNLPKEVVALINTSVLRKVEAEDKQVTSKKDTQKTNVVNSEPLVGSLCGDGSCRRQDGRN